MPEYKIHPLRNGRCVIAGHHAFSQGNPEERYTYALFVWLILGGDKPIVVDVGLRDVEQMNRGAAGVLAEPITQRPEEAMPAQLARFDLRPEDVGYVFLTHMHFDHVNELDRFTQAVVCVGKREFELATANQWRGSWAPAEVLDLLCNRWADRLRLVEDEQVLPGIRTFWIGGHTPGSIAIAVNTKLGTAVLTGDTVSLLANIEKDIPVGVCRDVREVRAAMRRIRGEADIVLPSHDPNVFERFPEEVIG